MRVTNWVEDLSFFSEFSLTGTESLLGKYAQEIASAITSAASAEHLAAVEAPSTLLVSD